MYDSEYTDTKKARLEGPVVDVAYRNDDTGFAVVSVGIPATGGVMTAVGVMPGVAVAESVAVLGEFVEHEDYGRQFSVESCRYTVPETETEILAYLQSGVLPGITRADAFALVKKFGERSLEFLACAPEKLAEVPGLSRKDVEAAHRRYIDIFDMRENIANLAALGFSPAEAVALHAFYGNEVGEVLNRNPYVVCQNPLHLSVKRADLVAGGVQFESEGNERLRAIVLHSLRGFVTHQHTCAPDIKLVNQAAAEFTVPVEAAEAALAELVGEGEVFSVDFDQGTYIYLPEFLEAETDAALRLLAIARGDFTPPANMAALMRALEAESGIHYAKNQRKAIETAMENGAIIITGGPGTGKTTALNAIITLFESGAQRVMLAAPTGRAAKRMSELTGRKAQTIHRLLEVDQKFDMGVPRFKRNEQNPLKCDVVIVDEMSMMDAMLFDSLLHALRPGCRLVMVGDADQLPSVSAGNVLPGITASLTVPVVKLDEVFRQSAESLIVTNAHGVLKGKTPRSGGKKDDFFFMQGYDAYDALDTICQVVGTRLPKAFGFSPMADIQVLCPGRYGELGTEAVGKKLQAVLNPPAEGKPEIKLNDRVLRLGDKVMHVVNNYDIPFTRTDGEPGEGAFNGDIGVIEEIDPRGMTLTVLAEDRHVHYAREHLRQLEPAYAVTVHKSQGSEFEAVILTVAGVPPLLRTRNLLYTGITRAKKLCILVGDEKTLAIMVRNDRQNERYSCFDAFLRFGDEARYHISGGEGF